MRAHLSLQRRVDADGDATVRLATKRRRAGDRGIMLEDCPLQEAQIVSWFQAELLVEHAASRR